MLLFDVISLYNPNYYNNDPFENLQFRNKTKHARDKIMYSLNSTDKFIDRKIELYSELIILMYMDLRLYLKNKIDNISGEKKEDCLIEYLEKQTLFVACENLLNYIF